LPVEAHATVVDSRTPRALATAIATTRSLKEQVGWQTASFFT